MLHQTSRCNLELGGKSENWYFRKPNVVHREVVLSHSTVLALRPAMAVREPCELLAGGSHGCASHASSGRARTPLRLRPPVARARDLAGQGLGRLAALAGRRRDT